MSNNYDLCLPVEIITHELLPRLDELTFVLVQHGLFGYPLPPKLTDRQEELSIVHGMKLFTYLKRKKLLRMSQLPLIAARAGSLEMLKYARKKGLRLSPDICNEAATSGRLDILIWAIANGCERDDDIAIKAAKMGNLHILKYLKQNDLLHCRYFGPDTIVNVAASRGYFDLFVWAVINGCVCDKLAILYAADFGSLPIIKWLANLSDDTDIPCPLSFPKSEWIECARTAAAKGHLGVLNWIKDNMYIAREWPYG